MKRIFNYELRRLLVNKFYLCLLIINGFSAWYVLTSDIIAGVAYTAPFSKWSYGAYISSLMPVLIMTVLFLLTFFYSKNAKKIEPLIKATSVDVIRYTMIRMAVILLGFMILLALVAGISFYFYSSFFDFHNYGDFIIPAVVSILPGLILFMAAGLWAGRIHIGFLYALIPVSLLINISGVPVAFDIFGKGYYSSYPMSPHLSFAVNGEPLFVLNQAFLITRLIYIVIGAALFFLYVLRLNKSAIR